VLYYCTKEILYQELYLTLSLHDRMREKKAGLQFDREGGLSKKGKKTKRNKRKFPLREKGKDVKKKTQ